MSSGNAARGLRDLWALAALVQLCIALAALGMTWRAEAGRDRERALLRERLVCADQLAARRRGAPDGPPRAGGAIDAPLHDTRVVGFAVESRRSRPGPR